ncbi:hypothetical protein C8R45DRAFT_611629 [Mycena sanguinolenta]|nr:hypothetical protein C8R45DRAFT_611508 [Mycena sanguinolenta]KAJ6502187.1 hypothetical protein C8R45DRAFT_611561 [Mycena sanguinolenta]KAJ6502191.1 hypothetical protein C8R45DRAFT_611629 [Mycena sanguinolenta]
MSLHVGDILAVLFSRTDEGTFHWTICVPISHTVAAKFHVRNTPNDWWFDEPVPDHSILHSNTISAAVKIGTIDHNAVTRDDLTRLLRTVSMTVPAIDQATEPTFTCRVWFREAIRVLHRNNIINCPDVDELEKECRGYASTNHAAFPQWRGYTFYTSNHSA